MSINRGAFALAALAAANLLPVAEANAQTQMSKNWYRIPYADGTSVKVTRDHQNHTPAGRVDMVGKNGSNYKIVAAADGIVRAIEDRYSQRISGGTCFNNYVWIEHANGEWSKYSHMRKRSTTETAGLKVGMHVKAGRFLGYEDDVGCASGNHLHFEVGVPDPANPFSVVGGFLVGGNSKNRVPRICGIAGGSFDAGKTYVAAGDAPLKCEDVKVTKAALYYQVAKGGKCPRPMQIKTVFETNKAGQFFYRRERQGGPPSEWIKLSANAAGQGYSVTLNSQQNVGDVDQVRRVQVKGGMASAWVHFKNDCKPTGPVRSGRLAK